MAICKDDAGLIYMTGWLPSALGNHLYFAKMAFVRKRKKGFFKYLYLTHKIGGFL